MPARKRLTLRPDGSLVDREGHVFGVLESLTVVLSEDGVAWGVKGGVVDSPSSTSASPSPQAQASLLPPEGVSGGNPQQSDEEKVWAHYQRVIPGGERFKLDPKRSRIIRNALAVRPLAAVLAAIDGLAASPHHNGKNDRRKKYLGIQYALCGIGNESNDERIDKMGAKATATVADFIDNLPSAGREMVRDHMNKVAASLLASGDDNLRSRAEGSATYLLSTFGLAPHVRGDRVEWSRSATT